MSASTVILTMSSPGLKACLSLSLVFCIFIEISASINSSSHDPITFSVFHIGHLMRPFFKDYESFAAATLARDRAPFSLATSSHHLNGQSSLGTDYTAFPLIARRNGGYIVRVQVGTQRQVAHLLLDTGSSFIWWQCYPCTNCFLQEDPSYDVRNSKSYSTVDCWEEECNTSQGFIAGCLEGGNCGFRIQYVDSDEARGILAYESIRSEDGRFSKNVIFGCASNNTGTFFRGMYSGILGFGMGPYSFPRLVDATKFSFCLINFEQSELFDDEPNYTSPLYLNDIPPPKASDKYKALVLPILPVDDKKGFYRVGLVGVSIGDEKIRVSPYMWSRAAGDGVLIDSGTIISRFPRDVYSVFLDKFKEEVWGLTPFEAYGFDLCYDVKSDNTGDFPPVSFHFVNNSEPLQLPPEHVVVRLAYGIYCLAFSQSEPLDPYTTLIGSYQLQRVRQTYDLSKRTITLYPMSC